MLLGAIAAARGNPADACKKLEDAALRFTAIDMALYASATRRRLGELVGGTDGDALVRDADVWFASNGVRNPEQMTATVLPPLRASLRAP
jgi:hypothetical protein